MRALFLLLFTGLLSAQAPAPLTEAGTRNLVAFAKAYGCLRWFHPTDTAVKADWDQLAANGVVEVEPATSAADLAGRLRIAFAQVAPTAQFLVAGKAASPQARPMEMKGVVTWAHTGVGLSPQSIYRSTRTYGPVPDEPLPPLVKDLGNGVRLVFSTGIPVDGDRRTLPVVTSGLPAPGPADPARARRLGAAVQAWNVIQHFFPIFEYTDVDWSSQLPEVLKDVAPCATDEAALLPLRAMFNRLKDGHAAVSLTTPNPATPPQGRPGIELVWVKGELAVAGVVPELADLVHPGDRVVALEGESMSARLARTPAVRSTSTRQDALRDQAKRALLGPEGPITLDLVDPEGKPRRVELLRKGLAYGRMEPRPDSLLSELRPGVWYLDLAKFKHADVEPSLEKLAAARAIILDMRGYPVFGAWQRLFARFTDKPLETPPFLIPKPTRPDREGMVYENSRWFIQPVAPKLPARLIFLSDARAISQSELLLDFVEYYKLGDIVGGPSAGIDGNVNTLKAGGFSFSFTGMKVPKHDGSPLNGVGILPTVPVERTLQGLKEGRDEVLEAALALAR